VPDCEYARYYDKWKDMEAGRVCLLGGDKDQAEKAVKACAAEFGNNFEAVGTFEAVGAGFTADSASARNLGFCSHGCVMLGDTAPLLPHQQSTLSQPMSIFALPSGLCIIVRGCKEAC
jgi:hypothetical protein